jgi:uncharacterized membrane protein YedE/YeeE
MAIAESFAPAPAAIGGVLIGAAAAMLWLSLGRIAGISGIVGSFLTAQRPPDWTWRAAFIGGLIVGPALFWAIGGRFSISLPSASIPALLIAGLLVGFGTRLGSGCTSGHGVCGLARFSPRSLIATILFIAAGIVTVTLLRILRGG